MNSVEPPSDWRLRLPHSHRRWIRVWLSAIAATTFLVLVVGGVTRLTHSGLSMVDWQPLIGIVPPLGEAQWVESFARYQQYPEFQQLRPDMTLGEVRATDCDTRGVVPPAAPHAFDFDRAPFLVVWEVTRACALACVHCRADAIARRDPNQLTTDEGFAPDRRDPWVRRQPPLLVLTGGDPMLRRDLADLVRYASRAGLSVALTPSGTAAATRRRLEELRDAGLRRVAVSLDGRMPRHTTLSAVCEARISGPCASSTRSTSSAFRSR